MGASSLLFSTQWTSLLASRLTRSEVRMSPHVMFFLLFPNLTFKLSVSISALGPIATGGESVCEHHRSGSDDLRERWN